MKCINCGNEMQDGAELCPNCQAKQGGPQETAQEHETFNVQLYSQPDVPLRWYKSIIYFWMFAGAIADMVAGALLLATTTELKFLPLYSSRPGIEAIVGIFGVLWLIRFGYAFYVRSKMAEFHGRALGLFFGYELSGLVLPALFYVAVSVIGGVSFADYATPQFFVTLGLSAFMILSNILYFKKRAFLFEDYRSRYGFDDPVLVAKPQN